MFINFRRSIGRCCHGAYENEIRAEQASKQKKTKLINLSTFWWKVYSQISTEEEKKT